MNVRLKGKQRNPRKNVERHCPRGIPEMLEVWVGTVPTGPINSDTTSCPPSTSPKLANLSGSLPGSESHSHTGSVSPLGLPERLGKQDRSWLAESQPHTSQTGPSDSLLSFWIMPSQIVFTLS